jgi:hypothetical protein
MKNQEGKIKTPANKVTIKQKTEDEVNNQLMHGLTFKPISLNTVILDTQSDEKDDTNEYDGNKQGYQKSSTKNHKPVINNERTQNHTANNISLNDKTKSKPVSIKKANDHSEMIKKSSNIISIANSSSSISPATPTIKTSLNNLAYAKAGGFSTDDLIKGMLK